MVDGDLRGDGPRRDVRPARRRLRPLLGRRAAGWCRTSRRCSTTTPCCCGSTRTCGARPGPRWPAGWRVETADFLLRELRTAEGGFASASTPTRDGVEGAHLRLDAGAARRGARRRRRALGRRPAERHRRTGTFEHGASTLQLRADPDDPERWDDGAGTAARRPRDAAAAGPRRQGGRRLERPGGRGARRGRRAARPTRPASPPRRPRPTCSGRRAPRRRPAAAGRPGTASAGAHAGRARGLRRVAEGLLALRRGRPATRAGCSRAGDAARHRARRTSPPTTAASTTPPTTPSRGWSPGRRTRPTTPPRPGRRRPRARC